MVTCGHPQVDRVVAASSDVQTLSDDPSDTTQPTWGCWLAPHPAFIERDLRRVGLRRTCVAAIAAVERAWLETSDEAVCV